MDFCQWDDHLGRNFHGLPTCENTAKMAVPHITDTKIITATETQCHSADIWASFSATERFISNTSGMSNKVTMANTQKQSK
jgi:hypothetical protein